MHRMKLNVAADDIPVKAIKSVAGYIAPSISN